ncbi:hypothetical protein ACFPYI_03790 [Halomarina salina]|uniref:Uncharacterized protein n=1 Tax=Halomarina salina TaxID=1872699 RepID=A0ABD5RIN8_9EURY|nr:hypothetical protein [Halomarina salina]
MLPALAVGLVVLPYATLWVSRSGRVRAGALTVARQGWHTLLALAGVSVGLLALGTAGGVGPAIPLVVAWAAALLGVVAYAHVDLFVAAAAMRTYPDDRALHYDLAAPRTWAATSARIVSAWGVVMRRHGWLLPAFLLACVLFALGPSVLGGVGVAWWLALAADALVLGVCCLPFPRLVALPAEFTDGTQSGKSRTSIG